MPDIVQSEGLSSVRIQFDTEQERNLFFERYDNQNQKIRMRCLDGKFNIFYHIAVETHDENTDLVEFLKDAWKETKAEGLELLENTVLSRLKYKFKGTVQVEDTDISSGWLIDKATFVRLDRGVQLYLQKNDKNRRELLFTCYGSLPGCYTIWEVDNDRVHTDALFLVGDTMQGDLKIPAVKKVTFALFKYIKSYF